jgi:DMSO/TMAO reductase YedYZ molybdopterin-dependent catalytic subunit
MRAWFAVAAFAMAVAVQAQERASLVTTQVAIAGEVQHEMTLTVDALKEMAQRRGKAEARGYGGVRLTDVLMEADIRQDAQHALRRTYVVAIAADKYAAVFSWGELFNSPLGRGVLIAYERDGQPLRDGEGRIALVSLADERPGTRHVKWLTRIDVRRVAD